jgi:hypothetical protein
VSYWLAERPRRKSGARCRRHRLRPRRPWRQPGSRRQGWRPVHWAMRANSATSSRKRCAARWWGSLIIAPKRTISDRQGSPSICKGELRALSGEASEAPANGSFLRIRMAFPTPNPASNGRVPATAVAERRGRRRSVVPAPHRKAARTNPLRAEVPSSFGPPREPAPGRRPGQFRRCGSCWMLLKLVQRLLTPFATVLGLFTMSGVYTTVSALAKAARLRHTEGNASSTGPVSAFKGRQHCWRSLSESRRAGSRSLGTPPRICARRLWRTRAIER